MFIIVARLKNNGKTTYKYWGMKRGKYALVSSKENAFVFPEKERESWQKCIDNTNKECPTTKSKLKTIGAPVMDLMYSKQQIYKNIRW